MRLRVECHTWLMLSSRHTNRGWLQGLVRDTFTLYTDFFLGKKVMLINIPVAGVEVQLFPPWSTVLAYERECRKLAFRMVREDGTSLNDALMACIRDSECKECHFTTPIALGNSPAMKRQADGAQAGNEKKKNKGAGRGNGKGGGKGGGRAGKGAKKGGLKGGKKGAGKYQSKTPDGLQICFNFNNGTCTDPCPDGRVHVCSVKGCQDLHPSTEHVWQ